MPEGTLVAKRSPWEVGRLSDIDLEDRLKRLTGIERKALVLLLAHLGEFDQRRLYADRGQPSLFAYCLCVLGYSEQAAYKRIQAARAAREHPEILRALADGAVTLTAVVILAPHFREDNAQALLDAAGGKRTRQVEAIVASLAPQPDAPDCLRALPLQAAAGIPASAGDPAPSLEAPPLDSPSAAPLSPPVVPPSPSKPREVVETLSADRHLFRFTGSSGFRTGYERARRLLGTGGPGSSMEAVFEAALDALLDKRDPERRNARRAARTASRARAPQRGGPRRTRRVSAGLADEVWVRDGGRCTFNAADGARCPATSHLEVDHIRPYALGGASDDAGNLRLLCRTHNRLQARRIFGGAADRRTRSRKPDYP